MTVTANDIALAVKELTGIANDFRLYAHHTDAEPESRAGHYARPSIRFLHPTRNACLRLSER